MSRVLTVNSEGKMLYAIYAERRSRRGNVDPQILHVHAKNEGEARWIFSQDSDYRKYIIIAVAPAVGFFVEDNHGDILVT